MKRSVHQMSTKERLKEFLSYKKVGRNKFENSIGVSEGYLSSKSATITSDVIEKAVDLFTDLNLNWLITGKGEMLRSEDGVMPVINHEFRGAPYYNVDFIGGFDVICNNQTINPDYYIDFKPYNENGVIWCNITGKSMEPEINSGDIIAMKELTTNIEYLPLGEVYGFVTNEYRTVKKLGRSDKDGYIRLIPTNKSEEFSPQDIPANMVIKVFSVLGSVKRF